MIPRVSKHSVVATHVGGQAFEVSVRSHTVRTDQPVSGGGEDTAPTPLEMMSVALAGCVALYVQRYCTGRGLDARGLAVEVNPVWKPEPGSIGRFDVLLHLPGTIPGQHRDALEQVARTCPVHHTFVHSPEITVRVVPGSSSSAEQPRPEHAELSAKR